MLIVEVKNQGMNDLRAVEGKPRQAKGNAIERLGNNVIGFRTAMVNEGERGRINRGGFFFRENPWREAEMTQIIYDVAQ